MASTSTSTAVSSSPVALVTGGASGMGLGLVERLVARGWKVTVVDFNDTLGTATGERLGAAQVLFVKANVVRYDEQVEAFVQTWRRWGRLDLVWANAGIGDRIDFVQPAPELPNGGPRRPDTLVLDVCLNGAVWTSYLALHYFRKSADPNGLLVLTASMAGIYPASSFSLYGAAKHGIVGLTRSTAARLQKLGLPGRINCVCPGLVPTPLVSQKLVAVYPPEMITPVETVVRAIEGFIADPTVTGQVAECSALDVIYRPAMPFGNRASEYVIKGEYRNLIDVDVLFKDAEEKGKKYVGMAGRDE